MQLSSLVCKCLTSKPQLFQLQVQVQEIYGTVWLSFHKTGYVSLQGIGGREAFLKAFQDFLQAFPTTWQRNFQDILRLKCDAGPVHEGNSDRK